MSRRTPRVFIRGAFWLVGSFILMMFIGQRLRPDVPLAERLAGAVTAVAPFMDGVFAWFRT